MFGNSVDHQSGYTCAMNAVRLFVTLVRITSSFSFCFPSPGYITQLWQRILLFVRNFKAEGLQLIQADHSTRKNSRLFLSCACFERWEVVHLCRRSPSLTLSFSFSSFSLPSSAPAVSRDLLTDSSAGEQLPVIRSCHGYGGAWVEKCGLGC